SLSTFFRYSSLLTSLICPSLFFFFFFYCSGDHRDLHSFPTRRSSDLPYAHPRFRPGTLPSAHGRTLPLGALGICFSHGAPASLRSEEHTSELQSHLNLVCRLLLEKKKKKLAKNS